MGGGYLKVQAFDLTRQHKQLEDSLVSSFSEVLESGHFILGKEVKLFEEKIAHYLDVQHAITVANGSDALLLSLMALGIGPGDEVIVPAFTFFATAGAVSRVGAIPVFVDVRAYDYNIDPEQIRAKVTPKTKAIIPVHLFGMPADMKAIMEIAGEHELFVIEDTAQALGTTYNDQPVGTIGDVGCYSFFPTKNLGCLGDGGMMVTNNPDLAEVLRMLRVHGAKKKYSHEMLGINSRLDTIQAAFLKAKMPFLNQWIQNRRRLAANYREAFQELKGLKLPVDSEEHTYNQFTIKTSYRDELRAFLTENAIETTIYYPLGLHLQPVFSYLGYREGDLPVSESLSKQVLSLPLFPELTENEQSFVIYKVKEFFEKRVRG